jgi:hypothetical protein
LPESPVKHVALKNVHIDSEFGADLQYAQVIADDFVLKTAQGEAITKGPGVIFNQK